MSQYHAPVANYSRITRIARATGAVWAGALVLPTAHYRVLPMKKSRRDPGEQAVTWLADSGGVITPQLIRRLGRNGVHHFT